VWNTQPNQKERTEMSNYNWCHNEKCHTYHTTDRIRGSKGNKVLRTRKIKVLEELPYYYQGWENHFCKVGCLFEYIKKHINRIVEIAPVNKPSETPIEVQTEKVTRYHYSYDEQSDQHVQKPYMGTETKIVGEIKKL